MTEGERSLRRSRRSFLALTGGERSLRVLYTLKRVKDPRDDLGDQPSGVKKEVRNLPGAHL